MLQKDGVKGSAQYNRETEEEEDLDTFVLFIKTDIVGITSQNSLSMMKGQITRG